jgi:hypothetical protein
MVGLEKTCKTMKKTLCFILVALIFLNYQAIGGKKKVLFIGNSYVATNNLPAYIQQVALSMGDTLVFDANAPGGFTLRNHFQNATTRAKITAGGWDLVVIQAQSQEPAFPDGQVESQTLPYARKLDSLINVQNPCTETQFYLTWGRKNGDASNCAAYPPICTYAGMQDKLTERYLIMAQEAGGSVAPVGEAWRAMILAHPTIDLYVSDQSHPNATGTYLAALVFYQSLFQKPIAQNVFRPAGMQDSTYQFLKTAALKTVQDSAKTWFRHGRFAKAGFSYAFQNNAVVFENQSYGHGFSRWDFGDGTTSNLASPTHNFSGTGSFVVKLKVGNECRADSISKTVFITGIKQEEAMESAFFPNPAKGIIHVPDGVTSLIITSSVGTSWQFQVGEDQVVLLDGLPSGIYYVQGVSVSRRTTRPFKLIRE